MSTPSTIAAASAPARRADIVVALVFAALTFGFVLAMVVSPAFFAWSFARHHNLLSWYVRPLFLVPFCVFAFRRSCAGMSATIFLLATSMFWFPAPDTTAPATAEFLRVEQDYLTGPWGPSKIAATVLVPVTLTALAAALWRRNLALGVVVLVLIAVLKMAWSVLAAGGSGTSIFVPALAGLVVCVAAVRWMGRRTR